jgi:Protein of unknown function (DUF2510)
MTTPPPGPDWYPDPSGKPGLMYWDGRQWHSDVPTGSAPAGQPPQPVLTTQPQRPTALTVALFAAFAILFGIVGVTGYLVLKRSHPSQTPTAHTTPAPALPPLQGAPPQGPTTQSAPASSPPPTSRYFMTPSAKACQVTARQVTCQTCIPGDVITSVYTCPDRAPVVAVNEAGIVDQDAPDMASPSGAQQLADGQTYHTDGWTIVTSGGWTRFINDTTGHGMAIAGQNFESF